MNTALLGCPVYSLSACINSTNQETVNEHSNYIVGWDSYCRRRRWSEGAWKEEIVIVQIFYTDCEVICHVMGWAECSVAIFTGYVHQQWSTFWLNVLILTMYEISVGSQVMWEYLVMKKQMQLQSQHSPYLSLVWSFLPQTCILSII